MAGFQTFGSDGRLQIDSASLMYGFFHKGSVQVDLNNSVYFNYFFVENLPPHQICALRCTTGFVQLQQATIDRTNDPNGFKTVALGQVSGTYAHVATVEYWLFKEYRYLPDTDAGLILYNASGVKTFDAGHFPLRIVNAQPVTNMYDYMNEYRAVGQPGRVLAYFEYGTTTKELFPAGPYTTDGSGIVIFNGGQPMVRDAGDGNGYYLGMIGSPNTNAARFAYGDHYAGGILVADMTHYV